MGISLNDKATMDLSYLLSLYNKYDGELRKLARLLRIQYHKMQRLNYRARLADVEGEVMYMLIREKRPELIFEISPNYGWSTNYILSALTANPKGVVHSFEILPKINGKPTEQIIRQNQHPLWDQERLIVHIGDARDMTPKVEGKIDFLFLDSCHEDWFANWYINSLFPRVEGTILIHDIAQEHVNSSSEARYVLNWLRQHKIAFTSLYLVGVECDSKGKRRGYAERCLMRSWAIGLSLPSTSTYELPAFTESVWSLLQQAETAASRRELETAESLLNEITQMAMNNLSPDYWPTTFKKAGSLFEQLGEKEEASRCFKRALGSSFFMPDLDYKSNLFYLLTALLKHRKWQLVLMTLLLILSRPSFWFRLIMYIYRPTKNRLARLVRRI
ncbi:class I SAM-dependent methyltransferase [Desulfobacterota bacterium AH_259_B03_O07]|nr:class I SAM-dependent methyltransferase [Desulfobacterota bacterium AH_259_B03_O07]